MTNAGMQQLLDEFLLEARERADEVENLILRLGEGDVETRQASLVQVKRELHTLKGNSGMMGFHDLQGQAHQLEDQVEALDPEEPHIDDFLAGLDELRRGLEAVREVEAPEETAETTPEAAPREAAPREAAPREAAPPATAQAPDLVAGSVRVPFSKIDQLVELQAETLIFRNRLADALSKGLALQEEGGDDAESFFTRSVAGWEEAEHARQELEKTLNLVQERVTEFGMVPLQSLFRSLGRIIHDESTREGKKVGFEIEGGDTPIDKTLLEAAGEVLGHLVRNSVIHGVETPDERRRKGKPEAGRVRVSAALEASQVRIQVTDDGAGIDLEALQARAEEMGSRVETTDSRFGLLFIDGISTRPDADLGAGRGVGLSAVKRTVERRAGRIEVRSERDVGCSFALRLPVTTSILRSLLIAVDGEEYALPLAAVTESQRLETQQRHEVNHARVVRWRGRLVPVLDLGLAFGTRQVEREKGYVIVIEVNGRARGLAADDIVGIRDIVVKGLDSIVGQPAGISGSTILGDGRVIMILDPAALAAIPPFVGGET
ncbi:MAG: hypothetical protein GY856_39790 [bacterium]|nr:hypothetical protein [bacterium]